MEKTIKVNPELFRIPVPKKSKRNKTAKRGQSIKKKHKKLEKSTNTLKKALIKKIQAHQERQRLHIEREQLRMKKENERLKEKLKSQEKSQEKRTEPPVSSFTYLKKLQESVKERKEQKKQKKQRIEESLEHSQKEKKDKSYLHEFLKKKERVVPKPLAPISLGKHTLHTQDIQKNIPPSTNIIHPTSPIPEPSTPIVLKEPPPYGILKGGSKPLYSSYRKTRKQHERLQTIQQRSRNHSLSETHTPIHVKSNVSLDPPPIVSTKESDLEKRRNKLRQIKALFKETKEKPEKESEKEQYKNVPKLAKPEPPNIPMDTSANQEELSNTSIHTQSLFPFEMSTPHRQETFTRTSTPRIPDTATGRIRKRIRRTTRRKYQVGKLNTPRGTKVHLLVKNRKTRKKQLMENKKIQKTPILEVRKYLRERNLIRVGSQAPEHILRQLYEASRSSGDVENKSSNVLLHNYMNTDGQTDGDLEPISQTEMNYDVETFLKEINGESSTTRGLGDTSALDAMLVNK